MIETYVAVGDLVNGIPVLYESLKIPLAVICLIVGAAAGAFGLSKGFGHAAGKVIGGIALAALIFGGLGLALSLKTTADRHGGGITTGQLGSNFVAGDRGDTARVYAEVRDFPIYISHIDENTRMWFAPWRVWDGLTALTGFGVTVWATWHWLDSGKAAVICVVGMALTAGATYLARQIPVSRPTPLYRLLWLSGTVVGTQRRTVRRPPS